MTEGSMTNITAITLTSDTNSDGFQKLIASFNKFKWPFVVIEVDEWRGFGMKLVETYNFLKANPQIDAFFFCDANDVVVLSDLKEACEKLPCIDKLVASSERGCWPDAYIEPMYDKFEHGFNYVNSGVYYSPSNLFIELMEANMPEYAYDDQRWLTAAYFANRDKVVMDNNCEVFQSHSFIREGDYKYKFGRVKFINRHIPNVYTF